MNQLQAKCVHEFTCGSQRQPGRFSACGKCAFERDFIENPTHFVVRNSATVFVKEADFFRSQGGLSEDWGRDWTPVIATDIGDARRQGASMFGMTLSHIYSHE